MAASYKKLYEAGECVGAAVMYGYNNCITKGGSMIIGRKREIEDLEIAFKSKESQFITVYGRRLVGKTYLIREFFKTKDCHFFHVTGVQNGKTAKQLEKFADALSKTFHAGS